jgi:S-adenosylmethionine-dependent methyltransferase
MWRFTRLTRVVGSGQSPPAAGRATVPDDTLRSRRWSLRSDPRTAVRTAVVWETLEALLGDRVAGGDRSPLDVVDVGGGTGGLAVPLAQLGHRVVVVDPSPDALAALQRRVTDAGVPDRVTAHQGDAGALAASLGEAVADLVLCHGVLEHVDDPRAAVLDALAVLRPGGLVSILVAQRLGAVLARALSGRFDQARRLLDDPGDHAGPHDPSPRLFDEVSVLELFAGRDVQVRAVHGVRLFTDLLPGALVDGDPEAAQALLDLERAASHHTAHPALTAVAAQLHIVLELPAG